MANLHEQYMTLALQAARKALPVDVPVGAVLVYDNQVIAEAYNQRELDNNPVAHAEMLALQWGAAALGNWRLNDTTLYVTLEPCPMCAAAIMQARVGRVVFGAYDPVMGACGSAMAMLTDSPALPVLGGVMEAECGQLLRGFFSARRQKTGP